jgi:hypothetical protein
MLACPNTYIVAFENKKPLLKKVQCSIIKMLNYKNDLFALNYFLAALYKH